MTSVSYYEARTHFSQLLDQVAKGKKILITRRGNILGKDLSIRALIEEGRLSGRYR